MEYRTLELTIISAKGLKSSRFGKPDIYAVASIYGTAGKDQKLRTPVHKNGGSNPTWNFPMKFTIDESAALQNRLTLVVKIKAVGMFGDKELGEVDVPIKELMEGKAMQFVSYRVRKPSGKPKGELSFSYKFGEKVAGKASKSDEPVTAYPPPYAAAGSGYYPAPAGYPPPPQAGYAYQQHQPGYTSYPPPAYGGYPAVQQPPRKSRFGMGLGTGLLGGALGGLLIGDMVSDAAYGGGCGGGGCGGGGCGGF